MENNKRFDFNDIEKVIHALPNAERIRIYPNLPKSLKELINVEVPSRIDKVPNELTYRLTYDIGGLTKEQVFTLYKKTIDEKICDPDSALEMYFRDSKVYIGLDEILIESKREPHYVKDLINSINGKAKIYRPKFNLTIKPS